MRRQECGEYKFAEALDGSKFLQGYKNPNAREQQRKKTMAGILQRPSPEEFLRWSQVNESFVHVVTEVRGVAFHAKHNDV